MQVHDCKKINLLAKKKFFWKKFWFKSEVVWYNGDKDFVLSIKKISSAPLEVALFIASEIEHIFFTPSK